MTAADEQRRAEEWRRYAETWRRQADEWRRVDRGRARRLSPMLDEQTIAERIRRTGDDVRAIERGEAPSEPQMMVTSEGAAPCRCDLCTGETPELQPIRRGDVPMQELIAEHRAQIESQLRDYQAAQRRSVARLMGLSAEAVAEALTPWHASAALTAMQQAGAQAQSRYLTFYPAAVGDGLVRSPVRMAIVDEIDGYPDEGGPLAPPSPEIARAMRELREEQMREEDAEARAAEPCTAGRLGEPVLDGSAPIEQPCGCRACSELRTERARQLDELTAGPCVCAMCRAVRERGSAEPQHGVQVNFDDPARPVAPWPRIEIAPSPLPRRSTNPAERGYAPKWAEPLGRGQRAPR